jgi:hypothetical protein
MTVNSHANLSFNKLLSFFNVALPASLVRSLHDTSVMLYLCNRCVHLCVTVCCQLSPTVETTGWECICRGGCTRQNNPCYWAAPFSSYMLQVFELDGTELSTVTCTLSNCTVRSPSQINDVYNATCICDID